jgi:prophage DNA circulation protein
MAVARRRRTVTRRRRNPYTRAEYVAESTMLAISSAEQRLAVAMENYYALQDAVEGDGYDVTKKMRTLWTRINALTKATKLAKTLAMGVQDEVYRMAGGE